MSTRKKGDRVSIIEKGVEYFGKIVKAARKECTIDFDDGEDGIYDYTELVGGDLTLVVSGNKSISITKDLYDRCRKKIGMSDVMIASYPDAEALKRSADGMHSKSDPDARVKEGVRPKQVKFPEMLKDVFTFESVLEAKFIKTNREHYDRGNLQQFLLLINRRYGTQKPIRIVEDKSLVPKKRELVTHYTIYFEKG